MTILYACDSMCMCVEFRDEILLKGGGGGGECKTREKFNFLKKGKTVILVETLEFF